VILPFLPWIIPPGSFCTVAAVRDLLAEIVVVPLFSYVPVTLTLLFKLTDEELIILEEELLYEKMNVLGKVFKL
jgi:hypothetical protein